MINNKIIYSIVMLLMGLQIQAQVVLSDKNYVHTTVPQTAVKIADMENVSCANANDVDNTIESVTYYDGLGRPIQQRAIKASPTGKDIVTHMQYDAYGRQDKQYLPFEANNTIGSYKTVDVNIDINAYYKNTYSDDFPGITTNLGDVNAYSESVFEASPLNRVTEQGAPGKAWKADPNSDTDHTIKFDWGTNASNEVVNFTVTFTGGDTEKPQLAQENHYAADQLVVTITKDENWTPADGDVHTTKEYKDKQGRVILKRTYASTPSATSEAHDTYYVYDSYGNLTYVIPPKVTNNDGVSNTELAELCYQYTYDYRNRLIEKKIPGKGWEYIIYNKLDQPVLTQDALLKQDNLWLFTKYDAFGRVVYTGLIENGSTVALLRSRVSSSTYETYETKTTSPITIAGTPVYYTNDMYPVRMYKILTINYYDEYIFDIDGLTNPGTVYGKSIDTNTKSLPTGSKIRVLDTNDWITTVTYYDDKSRPIYVATTNAYLNTTDVIESKLDFTGRVEETKTRHTKGGNAAIVTIDKFTYDHMGRLLTQTQKINTQDTEQIVSNTYDALGQLKQKDVGGTSTPLSGSNGTLSVVEGLQTVDYTYNIRGWLKSINDSDITDNILTLDSNDLFGFALEYDIGANPLYNGNISRSSWQTANDNVTRSYAYTYDALNRITSGISNDGRYNLSNISYDKMGNIISLTRTGHINEAATSFGVMDNLGYTYDTGNKLVKVADTANKTFGFKDGSNTNDDFSYDDNGNMITDQNKGITGITYNHLNLPKTVSISNSEGTGNITYIYDATGAKLKKIAPSGSSLIDTEYAGNHVYKNGTLQYMGTPEGYATPNGNSYRYVYQFKDHLDNVRLSYTKNDVGSLEIIEESNYYPFGLQHKGYNTQIISEYPYGYNGKEEQNELGLGWLDYGARNYNASLGRWMNMDPLASGYTPISPYTYVANSPVRLLDPDGRIIGDGIELFNRFRNQVNNKRTSIQNTIANRTRRVQRRIDRANKIGDTDKAASLQSSLDSRNADDQASIGTLNTIDSELNTLESSSQVYDIVANEESLPSRAGGSTTFNTETGAVTVNIGNGGAGEAAHEFKHAFQFDAGELSFDSSGQRGGGLYDLVDEFDAYKRSTLFGHSIRMNSLSDVADVYTSIRDRNSQLTLSTRSIDIPGVATNGQQLRSHLRSNGNQGRKPGQYFKGWRSYYILGSFDRLIKKL
ncbi:DUF6443 domain-containing protein [Aquimarina sp. AU119]|uniref:DUF6443 domain-containing protein n=1 Tax=Aquimarina sp. AU119 TaxID=2108528 RepID=UPI00135BA799|nr:DUF6443 domain-containing protein [Aquimarina sp. AU119]